MDSESTLSKCIVLYRVNGNDYDINQFEALIPRVPILPINPIDIGIEKENLSDRTCKNHTSRLIVDINKGVLLRFHCCKGLLGL